MSISVHRIITAIFAAALLAGCLASPGTATDLWPGDSKIKFQIDDIRADGLRGPPDGLVAVAYEFCVPSDEGVYQEIRQIDHSLQIHSAARGRSRCASNQSLAIGATNQTRWREVLQALSSLDYVSEIRECFFE